MSCQCSRKVVPAGTVRPRAHVKILRRRVVEHRVDHALGGYTNGAWWQSLMFIRVVRRIHLCVGIRDAPLCEITQCIFDCRAGLHGHTDSKAVDIQARYYLLIFRDLNAFDILRIWKNYPRNLTHDKQKRTFMIV